MNARLQAPWSTPSTDIAPAPAEGLSRVSVQRHVGALEHSDHDWVIDEAPVALVYNGVSHVVMLATPTALEDFAVGFSLSEGLLHGVDELRDLRVEPAPPSSQGVQGFSVHLEVSPRAFDRFKDRRRQLAGRTGCGLCGIDSLQAFEDALPTQRLVMPDAAHNPAEASAAIASATARHDPSATVRRALRTLPAHQTLQAHSGACHAAAWATPDGTLTTVCEDVGRHNALDKLIGALALAGQLPMSNVSPESNLAHSGAENGLVVVSSRASHEMVSKCVRVGVGTLGAISAPTSLAIALAQRSSLRLFGFCRGDAVVAYA
jgi:FdhD protein